MATVKTGYNKWESYVAFVQEATFGTAIADDQNFTKFDIIGGTAPVLSPAFFEDTAMRNRELNIADEADYYSTSNGEWQRLTIPQFIAPSDVLAEMIYASVQTVSEAVGSPYLKTYTLNGAANPDFSSNAGYFFTLLSKTPVASDSHKLTSCVMENLTINISAENGGRITAGGTALSGQGYTLTSNPSGTNAFSTVSVPNFHDTNASTLVLGGVVDIVWYSVELNFANRFAWLGHSSGIAENYKYLGSDLTGTVVAKLDTQSSQYLAQKGNIITGFALTIGVNSSAGYFTFTCNDAILRDITVDNSADDDVQKCTMNFDFRLDSSATQYPVIEVADGVDQTW